MKPECKLTDQDGNIYNLISIAKRTLKNNGMKQEAEELVNRIIVNNEAKSYSHALSIIMEYVEVI